MPRARLVLGQAHRRPAKAVALLGRVDRDVVHEHHAPPGHLPLRQPEPADRGSIGLDDEDVMAGCPQAHRQDGREVGFGLLQRGFACLAAVDLDSLRVAGLRGLDEGGELLVGDRSQADGWLGSHVRGDYRGW